MSGVKRNAWKIAAGHLPLFNQHLIPSFGIFDLTGSLGYLRMPGHQHQ